MISNCGFGLYLSVYLSFCFFCAFVFLFFCIFVFSSRHHYDQMFEGSQVFVQTERKIGERSMTLLKVKCSCDVLTGEKKTWHRIVSDAAPRKLKKSGLKQIISPKASCYTLYVWICAMLLKKRDNIVWGSISTIYIAVNFRTYQNPDLFTWPLIWTFCLD